MLVQVVALLSLGVLCSSAPTQGHSSRELVGSIIQEVLQDMQKLNLNAVSPFALNGFHPAVFLP